MATHDKKTNKTLVGDFNSTFADTINLGKACDLS